MGKFDPKTKTRAFIAVIHIKNMEKAGLSKEEYMNPQIVAETFTSLWNNSGKDRVSAIAVCESADGVYHAHMALYGNTTTLRNVAHILLDSHVEPQLGGRVALSGYMNKEGKYAEKGERVLYTLGMENIQDNTQGKQNIFEIIETDIALGKTPKEILERGFVYYKYERMIKKAFLDKKVSEMPLMKTFHAEYHCGESGSGKTFVYNQLCEKMSPDDIYIMTDYDNNATGGLDHYLEIGAPPVLFMDELKADSLSYGKLLTMLSPYTRMQTHCRYNNTYNLWSTCIITCIYPPEDIYRQIVPEENRTTDSFKQLLRRLDKIVYHYIENGEYKTFAVAGSDYVDYKTLIHQAKGYTDGFIPVDRQDEIEPQEKLLYIPFTDYEDEENE